MARAPSASSTSAAGSPIVISPPARSGPPRSATLLVDTSASRALGFASYVDSIRALAFALRDRYGELPIQLAAFDQTTQMIYDGSLAALLADPRPWATLRERGAEGASDLG